MKRVNVQARQGSLTATCLEEFVEEDAGTEYVGEVIRAPVFEKGEIGELGIDGKEVVFRVLVVDGGDGPLHGWMILGALDGRVDDMLGRSWALPGREEEPGETRHATWLSCPTVVATTSTDLSVNWTRGWQSGGAIAAHGEGAAKWLAPRDPFCKQIKTQHPNHPAASGDVVQDGPEANHPQGFDYHRNRFLQICGKQVRKKLERM